MFLYVLLALGVAVFGWMLMNRGGNNLNDPNDQLKTPTAVPGYFTKTAKPAVETKDVPSVPLAPALAE
ncbi:hypothetical protein M3Y98_00617900 [Aphelenchoides besseyi]|nr:hypothetical protein M3Y98_00617900 [Aphelenchoides besseyi]KAI6208349.1 hypothetical protein M3Y96_00105900 [Aphelenchoides besseyi]